MQERLKLLLRWVWASGTNHRYLQSFPSSEKALPLKQLFMAAAVADDAVFVINGVDLAIIKGGLALAALFQQQRHH